MLSPLAINSSLKNKTTKVVSIKYVSARFTLIHEVRKYIERLCKFSEFYLIEFTINR